MALTTRWRRAGRLEGLGGAPDREVVGLGAPAREHDFGRIGVQEPRYCRPCVVESGLGLLPIVMNTRCIAEKIPGSAGYRVGGLR